MGTRTQPCKVFRVRGAHTLNDPRREARLQIAKEALNASGLTRAQIARDTGLNEATIWGWLNGRSAPTPDSLRKLAEGLEHRSQELHGLAERVRQLAESEATE